MVIARHRTIARQLILVALHVLFLSAETKVVRDKEAREVRLGSGGCHSRQFAVGGIGESVNVAETPPARDLGIKDKLRYPG